MDASPLPVVSFIGKKKSGKTTVLLGVIKELRDRGYRVAVIKHDTHGFEIDIPGTDSYRFRELGAEVVGISSPWNYVWQVRTEEEPPLGELIRQIREPVDLVITEGFKRQDAPKIEVSRRARSTELVSTPDELIGITSDQRFPDYPVPQMRSGRLQRLGRPRGRAYTHASITTEALRARTRLSGDGHVNPPAGQMIDYLRLSVTDRCNFRCVYCMPPKGVAFKPHEEILSYEDMVFFVQTAVGAGHHQGEDHRRRAPGAQGPGRPGAPDPGDPRDPRHLAHHQWRHAPPARARNSKRPVSIG